jgi:hypothetical protein
VSENTQVVHSLIEIARLRGWAEVTVIGTERFRQKPGAMPVSRDSKSVAIARTMPSRRSWFVPWAEILPAPRSGGLSPRCTDALELSHRQASCRGEKNYLTSDAEISLVQLMSG